MKNVDKACICSTKDSQIKFEENKRKIIFLNPSNHRYKKSEGRWMCYQNRAEM